MVVGQSYASSAKFIVCHYPDCTSTSASWIEGLCNNHQRRQWAMNFSILEYGRRRAGKCEMAGCEEIGDLQLDHDNTCCKGTPRCGYCNRGFLCVTHNRLVSQFEVFPEKPSGPVSRKIKAYLRRHPQDSGTPFLPLASYKEGSIRQGSRWVAPVPKKPKPSGRKPFRDSYFDTYLDTYLDTEEELDNSVFWDRVMTFGGYDQPMAMS